MSYYTAYPATPSALSSSKGLHLLTMSTPNGQKAQIALEELKEAYATEFTWTHIDIGSNIQKEEWFLRLGGNGRIPVVN
jgi:glutathione S-transferase